MLATEPLITHRIGLNAVFQGGITTTSLIENPLCAVLPKSSGA